MTKHSMTFSSVFCAIGFALTGIVALHSPPLLAQDFKCEEVSKTAQVCVAPGFKLKRGEKNRVQTTLSFVGVSKLREAFYTPGPSFADATKFHDRHHKMAGAMSASHSAIKPTPEGSPKGQFFTVSNFAATTRIWGAYGVVEDGEKSIFVSVYRGSPMSLEDSEKSFIEAISLLKFSAGSEPTQ